MGDLNFGFVLISFIGIQSLPYCQKPSQKYKCKCTKILREKSSLSKKCRWSSTAEKREEAPIISLTFHQKLLFLSLSYEFRWAFSFSISSFFKVPFTWATPSSFRRTYLDDGWFRLFERFKQCQRPKYRIDRFWENMVGGGTWHLWYLDTSKT